MTIDSGSTAPGFDPARFEKLRGRLANAAQHGARKDLRGVREALQAGGDPKDVKAAVQQVRNDVNTGVDLKKIRDDKGQIRDDLKAGASPDQLRADVLSLKDDLRSFLQDSGQGFDKGTLIASFKEALRAAFHQARAGQGHDVTTPAPVDPGPVTADAPETVSPAPGAVDRSRSCLDLIEIALERVQRVRVETVLAIAEI
jgi:hypothetical protein